MKFLIAGLGNIGPEYAHTRHNIGFDLADHLCGLHQATFSSDRHADVASFSLKGKAVTVIKPTTYMNLSGKAVRYWMQELKIPATQLLVLVDDLAIDFGKIRIRPGGSDAGHNGLKNINELLLTKDYPRLRFGIGANYRKGQQIDYVLGKWKPEEEKELPSLSILATEAITSFILQGIGPTMSKYNQ